MRPSLSSHAISVEFEHTGDVIVRGYANEYAQVLLNIINNAKDVLIARHIESPRIKFRLSQENGHSVVTVRDNGGGIDAEILPKIFDPYFTTKDKLQGSGIGLYMSKAIIEENMGGSLTSCNVDNGAQFRIML